MSVREVYLNGVCRERWDNATRTYFTYSAAGAQTSTRAFTPEENAIADAMTLAESQTVNDADIANKIVTVDMPALATILADTNANINANPAQRIKDIAKAVRRLDRKVQRLLDGSD